MVVNLVYSPAPAAASRERGLANAALTREAGAKAAIDDGNARIMELDRQDRQILALLQAEGRLSNVDLSERIHLSASACARRVRRLEAAGVIVGYGAHLDGGAVGRGTTVFVEISLVSQREETLDAFEAAARDCPEVMECHLMAGQADYLLKVAVADAEDFARIHRMRLVKLPGVASMRSQFSLRRVKAATAFPLAAAGA